MQPGSVEPEQDFLGSCSRDGLFQNVKSADARCVCVNVGMSHQVINQRNLRPPVVGKAAEVRNDKIHVRIFLGQQS
jgi:hypothetical protein